jgi:tetratricopeptide (TPR) repeat protein
MGFFNRLFKSDPTKDLARAEKLLARGDAAQALPLIERAEQQGAGEAASALATQARKALVATALENAARAEESEYWGDAAEWLERVLDCVEGARREEFAGRIAEFHRLEKQNSLPDLPTALGQEEMEAAAVEATALEAAAVEASVELAPEELYTFYVDTLREDVAQHFENRPQSFRQAVVQLNEGEFSTALGVLEGLIEESSNDPILHLERGRARLAHGQFQGATADFDVAWEDLGDEPLDHAGNLSIPALWGEARLAQEDSSSVVERLRGIANPQGSDLETSKIYAQALLLERDFEEASGFLGEAWNFHPKVLDFPLLLSTALRGLDRPTDAIAILETVVAPSCGPGGCNVGAPHLPSMVTLIKLHLESGDPERARELLELLTGMRGGQLGREELLLMAQYYDRIGDEESSQQIRRRAEHASSAPMDQGTAPTMGNKQAIL